MGVPASQMMKVAAHVLRNVARRQRRYPLVLMLEPLFRCNLACAGCGKIQYPPHVLKRHLTPEECLRASDECGAPVVSLAGGEPLLHPEIEEIVTTLGRRGRFVYLCTNAILMRDALAEGRFEPDDHLTFSVHLDGPEAEHDRAVCRRGVHAIAVEAIRAAVAGGFRVTTNTTLFLDAQPGSFRAFFDEVMALGVEGITISPGYSYERAPEQDLFLRRQRTQELFSELLGDRRRSWRFNHSPLFLEFLRGRVHYECSPWGNPTYNVFGWQQPCYLLQEGYVRTFAELMERTEWSEYGQASGNEKCADCMVHSGHEASAVHDTFTSLRGFARTVRATIGS